MDTNLGNALLRFGEKRFGRDWIGDSLSERWSTDASSFYLRWLAWTAPDGETTLAEQYLARNAARLTPRERTWFTAQRAARLGIWMVLGIAGGMVTLRNAAGDEIRHVHIEGAPEVVLTDFVVARVVELDGMSFFSGVDPRPLSPVIATAIAAGLDEMQTDLQTREGAATLFDLWEEGIAILDEIPFVLADEDLREVISIAMEFDGARVSEVERRLETIDELADDGITPEGDHEYPFLNDDDEAVASVYVGDGVLTIVTAYEEYLDRVVASVEEACAGLLRNPKRSVSDAPRMAFEPYEPPAERAPELQARFRRKKEERYRAWLDEPLAALDGRTMRQAVTDPRNGFKVEMLLKELAWQEANWPEGERVDVSELEREIGIAP